MSAKTPGTAPQPYARDPVDARRVLAARPPEPMAHQATNERDDMFEKYESSNDLFTYKLGCALKMENTVVDMLDRLQAAAQSEKLRDQLRLHQEQTRQQISNIERAFASVGEDPDTNTDLVIEAIDKEGLVHVKRADDRVVDQVILAGAADTEHHEIAVYDWLITEAQALGHPEVAALLQQNLQQEQQTLQQVERTTREYAQQASA
jgi:ferritin-like metal-binding protein YciE